MKRTIVLALGSLLLFSCKQEAKELKKETRIIEEKIEKSTKQIKEELVSKGFQIFDYVDEKSQDTI